MPELLTYSFVRHGLLGATLVGACCSLLGVFVVLRGMSYIGMGIAHGCLAGVALAYLVGWNPLASSIVAALFMVLVIETVSRRTALKMDTAIGVVFSLAMALAVLFLGLLKRVTPDIASYLFGNLMAVTEPELWAMGAVSLVVGTAIAIFFKELQFSTFDAEMAAVSGIPAGLVSSSLSVLMGLSIVISLRAVGELLVLALIVLPASSAYQVTRTLRGMALISMSLGILASVLGLILAFYLDAPTGSTTVLLLGVFFLASIPLGRKGKVPRIAPRG